MKYPLLMRWSSLILVIGGVCLIIFEILAPTSNDLKVTLEPQWVALLSLALITNLCVAFGLVSLYLEQAEEGGGWGLLAFGLAFLACGLSVATAAIRAYVFPAFARMSNAPQCISPAPQCSSSLIGPGGPLMLVGQLEEAFVIFFLAGFIFLGIMIVRAAVLPRLPSWLLLISAVICISGITGPAILALAGNFLFGIALTWLGLLIWLAARARLLSAQPAGA